MPLQASNKVCMPPPIII